MWVVSKTEEWLGPGLKTQLPPTSALRSYTTTSSPASRRALAAPMPEGPAPMTHTLGAVRPVGWPVSCVETG